MAGGTGLSSAEAYAFATLKTDKDDYAPGETVTITGSGWQPGERVTLSLREIPDLDHHDPLTAVADASGNIANTEFSPDEHDKGIRFMLTAVGAASEAEITFTDSVTLATTTTLDPLVPSTLIVGQPIAGTGRVTAAQPVPDNVPVSFTGILGGCGGFLTQTLASVSASTGNGDGSFTATGTVPNFTGTFGIRARFTGVTTALGDTFQPSNSACQTITIVAGAQLTVNTVVVNDNGGGVQPADVPVFVDGGAVVSGTPNVLATGAHTVSFPAVPGYTGAISGDCAANGSTTLAANDIKACTVTLNDVPPQLSLDVLTSYTHGGTAPASSWTVTASGPTPLSGPGAAGSPDVVSGATFSAGFYTLSQSTAPAGYTNGSSFSCAINGAAPVLANTVSIGVGDVVGCAITNTDENVTIGTTTTLNAMPSTLVIGAPIAGGGQVSSTPAVPNALPVQLEAQLGGCGAGTWNPVAGGLTGGGNGTYVLSGTVPALAGTFGLRAAFAGASAGGSTWAASASTCQTVTIVAAPKLTVTAFVNNNNGGTLTPNALALFVDALPVVSGVQNTSTIGGHTVSATPVAGYSLAIAGDCAANGTITLAGNDVKACTVTASDTGLSISTTTTLGAMPSTLVIGAPITGGGQVSSTPAVPNALPVQLQAQLGGCGAGTWNPVAGGLTGGGNGTYVLSGTVPALAGTFGLRASFAGASAGASTWAASASACQPVTIVAAPKLTVTALVNNNNGGTLTPNDLALLLDAAPVVSGVQTTSTIGGHSVSATPVAGYTFVVGGDCAADGSITLGGNDVKACTVTASDTGLSISTTTTLGAMPSTLVIGAADHGRRPGGVDAGGAQRAAGAVAGATGRLRRRHVDAGGRRADRRRQRHLCPERHRAGAGRHLRPAGRVWRRQRRWQHLGGLGLDLSVGDDRGGAEADRDGAGQQHQRRDVDAERPGAASGWLAGRERRAEHLDDRRATPCRRRRSPATASCIAGDCAADGTITLAGNDVKACTVTASDTGLSISTTTTLGAMPSTLVIGAPITGGGQVASTPAVPNGLPVQLQAQLGGCGAGTWNPVAGGLTGGGNGTYVLGGTVPALAGTFGLRAAFGGVSAGGSTWAASASTCQSVTIVAAPKLTVTALVNNTNGGTLTPNDLALFVDGLPVASGVQNTSTIGGHTVSATPVAGYSLAIAGDCAANGTITLAGNDVKACTVTASDTGLSISTTTTLSAMPSTLVIGAPITGGGQVAATPAVPNGLPVQLQAQLGGCGAGTWTPVAGGLTGGGNGTYVLGGTVPALAGTFGLRAAFAGVSAGGSTWAASASTCQSVTIVAAPKLTVTALVNNTNGGTLTPNDLALFVDGAPVASGVQNTSTIGGHTVSATPVAGYSLAIAGDCAANGTITLAGNDVKACTVTASDTGLSISTTTTLGAMPSTLVIGAPITGGGQVAATPAVPNGLPVQLQAQLGGCGAGTWTPVAGGLTGGGNGTYVLGGTVPALAGTFGLRAAFGGVSAGGSTWAASASTCQSVTIVAAPKLTVTALVNNTNGGTLTPNDLALFVDGLPVASGVQNTSTIGGHTVSATPVAGYSLAIAGDCAANGTITLAGNDVKACTVTASDTGLSISTTTTLGAMPSTLVIGAPITGGGQVASTPAVPNGLPVQLQAQLGGCGAGTWNPVAGGLTGGGNGHLCAGRHRASAGGHLRPAGGVWRRQRRRQHLGGLGLDLSVGDDRRGAEADRDGIRQQHQRRDVDAERPGALRGWCAGRERRAERLDDWWPHGVGDAGRRLQPGHRWGLRGQRHDHARRQRRQGLHGHGE